jgi:hypothetical protein
MEKQNIISILNIDASDIPASLYDELYNKKMWTYEDTNDLGRGGRGAPVFLRSSGSGRQPSVDTRTGESAFSC